MRRPLAIATLCLLLMGLVAPAVTDAQATPAAPAGAVHITRQGASINFPAGIAFTLTAHADFKVTRLELVYRVASQKTENLALVPLAARSAAVQVTYRLDLQTNFLPAGIDLVTTWRFGDAAGRWVNSQPQMVHWYDSRYEWSTITMPDAILSYHGISAAFAQNIATSVRQSIDSLKALYGLSSVTPVRIWVYANGTDFAGSRQQNTREAVAGLSYPEYGLITAVIPDGNASELGRIMPHEISHQLLYQATRNPWNAPPVWLDEGLAEYAQTTGTDGFAGSVQQAEQSGKLLGLAGLSLSFPYEPQTTYLAYAESYSVVSYIAKAYGDAGVTRLVRALATGQSFDAAFQRALGRSMTGLEADWHAWIAQRTAATPANGGDLALRRAA